MEIKNTNDLRGGIAFVTALLNNICNCDSAETIKADFDQIKQLVTDIVNFKLKTLKEDKQMIDYKFIIRGRGEGKTKTLVDCLIDSLNEGATCVYVGSYHNFIKVRNMYEAQMNISCPMLFVDCDDNIRDKIRTSKLDLFTDELTNEIGFIITSSLINRWAGTFDNPRWYITLDKSVVI